MSLGIKSLWRVQIAAHRAKGLSLVSRESRILSRIYQPRMPRCSSTAVGVTDSVHGTGGMTAATGEITAEDDVTPPRDGHPTRAKTFSAARRLNIKQIIRQQYPLRPGVSALIERPVSKGNSARLNSKHRKSAGRQYLYDHIREVDSKPWDDWRKLLHFMLYYTPRLGRMSHLKVMVPGRAADRTRKALADPHTNVWKLQHIQECTVEIEEPLPEDEHLTLKISGFESSVSKLLSEVTKIAGQLGVEWTFDRSSDRLWSRTREEDTTQHTATDSPNIRTETIHNSIRTTRESNTQPVTYRDYCLTKRADEIPKPEVWTKLSFEQYVASLVHAQVPTHLVKTLYATGPDHQTTVISIILSSFISEHSRHAASAPALNLALKYMQSRGLMFRPEAREILHHVEVLGLPIDVETYNMYLMGASRVGDSNGFSAILRTMIRRGHRPDALTWVAFLEMIKDPAAKRFIVQKMQEKKLDRSQRIINLIGRHMAVVELTVDKLRHFDVREFVAAYDEQYGHQWLDTVTLNRLVNLLGSHGELTASMELLELARAENRVQADSYTLNTMITHSMRLLEMISFLQSIPAMWPSIKPDEVTYNQLFHAARNQRLPNMLRVVWRYGVLDGSTTYRMRWHLLRLLKQQELSKRRVFLQEWQDVIFGQVELAELRAKHSDKLQVSHVMDKYLEQAKGMKPQIDLATKLQEAYDTDIRIHKFIKDGGTVDRSVRERFSVDIPLVPDHDGRRSSPRDALPTFRTFKI